MVRFRRFSGFSISQKHESLYAAVYRLIRCAGKLMRLSSGELRGRSSRRPDIVCYTFSLSARRLLIVDDDCAVLSVTAALVGRLLPGVGIDTAESPHAALRNAQTTPYTAVLTDVCMPEQNGYELAARIRTFQPETQIVYMSGFDKDYRAEPFAFLRKPFDVDVFVATLRTALGV